MDFESDGYVYNMFETLIDVVHGEKRRKLMFATCINCGRISSFRPKSTGIQFTAFYCNHCGSIIYFGPRGKDSQISEDAEIFCEKC